MNNKKIVTILSVLVMLFSQSIGAIKVIADTILQQDAVYLGFEVNGDTLSNMMFEEGETKEVTLITEGNGTNQVIIELPNNLVLDEEKSSMYLEESKVISYKKSSSKVEINFNDSSNGRSETRLFLQAISSNDTVNGFFAQTTSDDGSSYQSDRISVTVEKNTNISSTQDSEDGESGDMDDSSDEDPSTELPPIKPYIGTVNADLDISPVHTEVNSGEDALFKLTFKVTGNQTTYYNGVIEVDIPKGYDISGALDKLEIMGVIPTFDSDKGVLRYALGNVTAGQTYTTTIRIKTVNGQTPNNTEITLNADFLADNYEGTSTNAGVNIVASSNVSTSKSVVKIVDSHGNEKKDPPTIGDLTVWKIKASSQKKDTSLLYIKEGSKIIIIDTVPEGMEYINDNAGGQYDPDSRQVVWEFDAPTLEDQKKLNDLDSLFSKEIEVTLKLGKDTKNFQKFTNKASVTVTDITDNTKTVEGESSITAGVSDPNQVPTVPGDTYLPWHLGPKGDNSASPGPNNPNPNPTVYDWARLKFDLLVTPWRANSETKNFEKYEITYNIDPNLNLEAISGPVTWKYSPDANHNLGGTVKVDYDVYVTINGEETLLVSNPKYDKPYQEKTLESLNIPKGTHVSKVRYVLKNPPAGLYSQETIRHIFNIEKGYTGVVSNTALYDVIGYTNKNEKIHWTNEKNPPQGIESVGDLDDKKTSTGVRTVNIIAKPEGAIPIGETGIRFVTSKNNVVDAGNNRIEGFFKANSSSPTIISKPLESFALLPVGVSVNTSKPEYQLTNTIGISDNKTPDGNNDNGTVTIVNDNFEGSNRQLVKISWNEEMINPDKKLTYAFNVVIQEGAPTPLIMNTYGYSSDKKITVPKAEGNIKDSLLQQNTDNMDGSGDKDKLRIKSGNNYRLVKENKVRTEKLVKGANDDSYSKFGYTNLGDDISYQLRMTNLGSKIGDFAMMDVLPSEGDLGITDNTSRGSVFTPTMKGPITISNLDGKKVDIKYSESKNPSREELVKNVDYPSTTTPMEDPSDVDIQPWLSEDEVRDWSKIHSFMVKLIDGYWKEDEAVTLSFNMKAPDQLPDDITNPTIDEKERAAWNSFAYTSNNSQVVEPERVGVVVNIYKVELEKIDKTTKEKLSGAVFELQDSKGKVLQSGLTTDNTGKLSIANLAPGKYQLVETQAPEGYQIDKTPIKFEIDKNTNTKVISLIAENKLTPGGVILEKIDGQSGKVLSGAVFELQDSKGKVLQSGLTTDNAGKLSITDLAPGKYQLVETQAPTGYELDDTPVIFEVVKEKIDQSVPVTINKSNTMKDNTLILEKRDKETDKLLMGAVFELRNEQGEVLWSDLETDENGIIELNNIKEGKYHLVEVKAPTGYKLESKPYVFEYNEGKEVSKLVIYNSKIPKELNKTPFLPKTGEERLDILMIIGVLLVIVSVVYIFVSRKSSQNR